MRLDTAVHAAVAGPGEDDVPHSGDWGVVALVPHSWAGVWSTRHHVLSRLARRHPVVWLEPSEDWRNAIRRLWRPPATRPGMEVPSGMVVHGAGARTPRFHRPAVLRRAAFAWRLRKAMRALRRRGCRRIILYIWRPE